MLHGPGVDAGGRVRVCPEVTGGGGDSADRIPVGDEADDGWHVLGWHQRVGDDREGEEDYQADTLGGLGALARDAEAGAAPGQGIAEEEEYRESSHGDVAR